MGVGVGGGVGDCRREGEEGEEGEEGCSAHGDG